MGKDKGEKRDKGVGGSGKASGVFGRLESSAMHPASDASDDPVQKAKEDKEKELRDRVRERLKVGPHPHTNYLLVLLS
jgi:hypothetical protein